MIEVGATEGHTGWPGAGQLDQSVELSVGCGPSEARPTGHPCRPKKSLTIEAGAIGEASGQPVAKNLPLPELSLRADRVGVDGLGQGIGGDQPIG